MTTGADLLELSQVTHADEAAAYEERVAAEAVGDADGVLAEALAAAVAAWVAGYGSVSAAGAGAVLARLLADAVAAVERALAGLGERARRALLDALPGAVRLGVRQGRAFAAAGSGRRPGRVGSGARPGAETLRVARAVADAVAEQLRRARALLAPQVVGEGRFSAVAAGLAVARSAVARVRAAVAWCVQEAVRTGVDAVAGALRLRRVWLSELDACVRCQAYAGEVRPLGVAFSGGRSWDPAQREGGARPVDGPPLHAHCRCRIGLWSPLWPRRGESLPVAAARQAREAVGRGWSLPSESGAARVRAARELLRSGAGLPAGVEAAARRAVREGRFDDRSAPGG